MGVIIGMDPHKRSATIEVVDENGRRLTMRRFGTDRGGYAEMLAAGREHPDRVWVEGCNGIGRHIAHRLVHDGESVVDVPPKLSAQVRVFATGNGRKTDPVDAHSVAMAAFHAPADPGLVRVVVDDDLVVMGMLVDRRDELGPGQDPDREPAASASAGTVPGRGQAVPVAPQARRLIATTKPRDLVGKTRRRLAVELIVELEGIDMKVKTIKKELTELVTDRGSTLLQLTGIGPSGAARLLADVGDITDSGTVTGSRPGTAPPAWTPPPATRNDTACPGREPADQPHPAHHGHRPAAEPHRRSDLLRHPEAVGHPVGDGDAVADRPVSQGLSLGRSARRTCWPLAMPLVAGLWPRPVEWSTRHRILMGQRPLLVSSR